MSNQGSGRRLKARVEAGDDGLIVGHALDLDDLEARLVVELWVEGEPLRLARACRFDAGLFAERLGDGCYGFLFTLDRELLRSGASLEARLANSGERLGEPLRLAGSGGVAPPPAEVRWAGGLRLTGWMAAEPATRVVRALVDAGVVAEARLDRWIHLSDGVAASPARAFDLDLPAHLADGRARVIRVLDETGRELPGSPVAVLAFEDGLERFCAGRAEFEADRPRAAIFDAMFPRAHPFFDYAGWARRFPPRAPKLARAPRAAVALLGVGDPAPSLDSLERQEGCDWVAGALGGPSASRFEPLDLGALIAEEAEDADFVVLAPAGSVFAPHALASFAEAFGQQPEARFAYADFTWLDDGGAERPVALTAFDYERMLEQGFAALVFAVRRAVLEAAIAAGIADAFALLLPALRLEPKGPAEPVAHVPQFLVRLPRLELDSASEALQRAVEAHLAARKIEGAVEPAFGSRLPAIRVRRQPASGRVSVVVATRGAPQDLEALLGRLDETADDVATDVLAIVQDNDAGSFAGLASERVRIARVAGPGAPERAYNAGANLATGDFLLFLGDDMRPLRSGWLGEMLGRLAEPRVGAVTPTLLWPSGLIRQSGLAVGPDFGAAPAFGDFADGELGYGEMLATAREVGAAPSAGLLVRRSDFLALGGFDAQRFRIRFAGADFSLRMRASGLTIVATPYARLVQGRPDLQPSDAEDGRARRELELFRYIWGDTLANDACYSPALALAGSPFSALAWPPRDLGARLSARPTPRADGA